MNVKNKKAKIYILGGIGSLLIVLALLYFGRYLTAALGALTSYQIIKEGYRVLKKNKC